MATTNMEHLMSYLHLEQYLRDLQRQVGEEVMLDYLALALEQIKPEQPKIRRVA
jgi:hypothetical protein